MEGGSCSFEGKSCSYCEQGASFECSCSDGAWACVGTETECACPLNEPTPGTACSVSYQCAYTTMEGCGGDSCSCVNGGWSCGPLDCPPPPPCPAQPPAPMSECSSVGQSCTFDVTNTCGQSQETCECDPSDTWGCEVPVCAGAGAVDAGAAPEGG
jgi:hypothetical protein